MYSHEAVENYLFFKIVHWTFAVIEARYILYFSWSYLKWRRQQSNQQWLQSFEVVVIFGAIVKTVTAQGSFYNIPLLISQQCFVDLY